MLKSTIHNLAALLERSRMGLSSQKSSPRTCCSFLSAQEWGGGALKGQHVTQISINNHQRIQFINLLKKERSVTASLYLALNCNEQATLPASAFNADSLPPPQRCIPTSMQCRKGDQILVLDTARKILTETRILENTSRSHLT